MWADICNWCSPEGAELAIARIRATKVHRRVFESVSAPGGLVAGTDKKAIQLIQHLAVLPVDFQLLEPSSSQEDSIKRCRVLLKSGNRNEAVKLWSELVRLAMDMRLGSGTLPLDSVWATLRKKFDLRDRPSFEGCWTVLKALTEEHRTQIQTSLPTGVVVDRKENGDKLAKIIREQSLTVVLGESGSGKSAAVKTTLDTQFPEWNQVWLGPEQADAATSEAGRLGLKLSHLLKDILLSSPSAENVLVIDSAERLSTASLPRIRQLIEHLTPMGGDATGLLWRIVVISQNEGWHDRLVVMAVICPL